MAVRRPVGPSRPQHVQLLQTRFTALTRVQRDSLEELLGLPGQGKLLDFPSPKDTGADSISERAEEHPETALAPSAQPHLILLPLPEHRGGHGCLSTRAPFYR